MPRLISVSGSTPPHTPGSTLFLSTNHSNTYGVDTWQAELRGGGLTVQILRPGQVDHSVADLSFFAQLAKVVPDAVKVYLLLWGETQICASINEKNYQESKIFKRKEKKTRVWNAEVIPKELLFWHDVAALLLLSAIMDGGRQRDRARGGVNRFTEGYTMGAAALFAALRFSPVIFSLHPPFQSAQLSAHHLFRVHALQNAPVFSPVCHVALCSD